MPSTHASVHVHILLIFGVHVCVQMLWVSTWGAGGGGGGRDRERLVDRGDLHSYHHDWSVYDLVGRRTPLCKVTFSILIPIPNTQY